MANDKKMAKSVMISSGSMVEARLVQQVPSMSFSLGSLRMQYLSNMPVPLSGWATPNLASPQSLRLFIGQWPACRWNNGKKRDSNFEERTSIFHSNSDGFFKV